jgi:ribonuclease R
MSDLEKRLRRILQKSGSRPMELSRLRRELNIKKREFTQYERILTRLRQTGELVDAGGGRVALARRGVATPATVVKSRRTFGFARLDDGKTDVFLPGGKMQGALPGDRVLLRVERADNGALDAGEVLSVTRRAEARLSGRVEREEDGRLVLAFDDNAFPPVALAAGGPAAAVGDKVVARILPADDGREHLAEVEISYGSAQVAKNCCDAILDAAGIPVVFSPELLRQAEQAAGRLPARQADENRLDLRRECIFTIDGADAKDIDDAVSLSSTPDGWQLGVHIADVGSYVAPGSLLDAEAYRRGTSVYFADSVIPMLPPSLSNGACSLNPCEDRFAFSALMQLSPEGELVDFSFRKTVIRSRIKGVYSEINAVLQGEADRDIQEKYAEFSEVLRRMHRLSRLLRQRRDRRGSINLSSVESKIIVGKDGIACDVLPRTQGDAEGMIEEFMLTANEAAAGLALRHVLPFVFRVHEPPSPDKLMALKELLGAVGIASAAVTPGVAPKKLSGILDAAKKTQYGPIVNLAMLRTMQKARYDDRNLGHFGLALANYTHFTSPIRRYSDLCIHRILAAFVAGEPPEALRRRFAAAAHAAARQASLTELRALGAERACEDCYKAEYMRAHLGERFAGIVVSAEPYGIYVQLDNTVEGLVRAELLGEEMLYDGRMQYASPDGSRRLRVGDRIQVTVAGADVATGRVDFALVRD